MATNKHYITKHLFITNCDILRIINEFI